MKWLTFICFFATAAQAGAQIFTGRVAMADGSPLPARVAIRKDCGGSPETAAYPDRNGQFRFQWGRTADLTPDASESTSRGPRDLPDHGATQPLVNTARPGHGIAAADLPGFVAAGCEVTAAAPGYRSNAVPLDGHDSDLGTIVLHPVEKSEESSVSASSLSVPPEAKKAYRKGVDAVRKGNTAEAAKEFSKAVSIYPAYASGWLELGLLESAARRWDDAAKHLETALRLDPVQLQATADNMGNHDQADKSAREALNLDSGHKVPQAEYVLGLIFVTRKDYRNAAGQFLAYLKLAPDGPGAANAKAQLERIAKLSPVIQPR
jgi:tetratricopeptide (TPR) repeat protein